MVSAIDSPAIGDSHSGKEEARLAEAWFIHFLPDKPQGPGIVI